jgi:hypothetical protein
VTHPHRKDKILEPLFNADQQLLAYTWKVWTWALVCCGVFSCPVILYAYTVVCFHVFMFLHVVDMCIVLTTYVHMYSNYGLLHVFRDH